MKVDLHVHTKERSRCATASEDEQIRAAAAAGLDAIVITDHARLVPPERLRALNERCAPLWVVGGIEITTECEDVLVLGVPEARLEEPGWTYAALHAFVRARRGFMAIAHPFRYHDHVGEALSQGLPDAIEVYSSNTPLAAEEAIRALAAQHGLTLLSDSDAHKPESLGRHYNLLPRRVQSEAELIAALRSPQVVLRRP